MSHAFNLGDPVLLVYNSKRKWIRHISSDQFHCNFGSFNLSDLINQPYGTKLESSTGKFLIAYPPTLIDWINVAFKHQSQIIYEKDAAMILTMLDIKPGDVIYETGTGSGSLTSFLARAVGRNGRIVTHDNRKQAIDVAKYNLSLLQMDNVEFNYCDIIESGFAQGEADGLVLDMGDPWRVIHHSIKILKPGRKIVIFLPTFDQLGKTAEELQNYNFSDIKAIELLEREIQLKPGAIRPSTRMIGHTGFLISAVFLG